MIEEYTIQGMGHGIPLDTLSEDGFGMSGAYMLEANIFSTLHICRFQGLVQANDKEAARIVTKPEPAPREQVVAYDAISNAIPPIFAPGTFIHDRDTHRAGGVRKIIEDALRIAGLIR